MSIPKNWRIDPMAANHVISDERRICSISYYNTEMPDGGAAWNEEIARLIAAAPDLLDLLTLALPYVEAAESDPAYDKGAVAKVTKQMRAAIEKATAS